MHVVTHWFCCLVCCFAFTCFVMVGKAVLKIRKVFGCSNLRKSIPQTCPVSSTNTCSSIKLHVFKDISIFFTQMLISFHQFSCFLFSLSFGQIQGGCFFVGRNKICSSKISRELSLTWMASE